MSTSCRLAISSDKPFFDALQLTFFDHYSPAKAAKLFTRFALNQTWQVPTLVEEQNYWISEPSSVASDPRLLYVDADWSVAPFVQRPDAQVAAAKTFFQRQVELVGSMHRAGVGILAGTDSPFEPSVFPGFSIHDELDLMVKSGLSPLQALQTATVNPARYLRATAMFGSIEEGKIADLVLLEANPLHDIRNTRTVHAVIAAGKLFSRSILDEMLLRVKRKTESPSRAAPMPMGKSHF